MGCSGFSAHRVDPPPLGRSPRFGIGETVRFRKAAFVVQNHWWDEGFKYALMGNDYKEYFGNVSEACIEPWGGNPKWDSEQI